MKAHHKIFIKEFLRTGDHVEAYLKAFPKIKSRKLASNGAKQLMRKNKEIAITIKDWQERDKETYERARAETIAKQAAEDVASEHEIKSLLTKIVRKKGVAAKVQIIKKGGKEVGSKQEVLYPSFYEQINAAKTLNEMCGYEAPKENVVTVREAVPELTAAQRKKFKDDFDKTY